MTFLTSSLSSHSVVSFSRNGYALHVCVCICIISVCIISVLERLWDIVLCWWDETRVVQVCMRRVVHWLYFPGYFVTSSSYSDL